DLAYAVPERRALAANREPHQRAGHRQIVAVAYFDRRLHRGLFVDQVDGVFALEDDDSKRVALSAGARGGRGQSCGTGGADHGPEHGASNGLLTRAPGTRSTMRTARTPTTTTQPAPGGLGEDVRDLESRGVTFTRGDAATTRGASASRLRILAAAPT